jgi:5'-deoxy-5'-methylthioadenosine phosphorylase
MRGMLAIIGGSGLSTLTNLNISRKVVATTSWGEASSPISIGEVAGEPCMFLARHGPQHTIGPHRINYRANIQALKNAGATSVLAVGAVAGIVPECAPGTIVIPDQLIDYTSGRAATFFDSTDKPVVHIDFTHPYSSVLREHLRVAAEQLGLKIVHAGVYGATNGPRLDTAAEVNRAARDGCTVLGMTGMPEAALARELDLAYCAVSVVSNWAAGRGNSAHAISLDDTRAVLDATLGQVRKLIEHFVKIT